MNNSVAMVTPFKTKSGLTTFIAVNVHSPFQKLGNFLRAFLNQRSHRAGFAQARARFQCVLNVGVYAVFCIHHGGNSALRPRCV